MRNKLALLIAVCLALTGCAAAPVQAWEKRDLARPAMALDGNTLERRFADHTHDSKEAARGGAGVGGGGCGCN